MLKKIKGYLNKFSSVGLLFGALFFSASLTASLLPRPLILQGVLSGVAIAVGYGIGCLLLFLWKYLQIPLILESWQKNVKITLGILSGFVIIYALGKSVAWQNSILELMDQDLINNTYPFKILLTSIPIAIILLLVGRLIRKMVSFIIKKTYKIIPLRIANLIGFVIAFSLIIFILNGVLIDFALKKYDSFAAEIDISTEDGIQQPTKGIKTGSYSSFISWETLGREGRNFISKGPSKEDVASFTETESFEPIRVYVGLNSKDTIKERAQLALAEMKRVGAFNRSIIVIVTPTGTGWMDAGGMDTLEYVNGGDTAIVSVQYSYLSSPIALLVNPELSQETANELFNEIYNHWTTLSKDQRPKLYIHGLSLGAFGSEKSTQLLEIINDPIDGALWTGPPFLNESWNRVTTNRNQDSPIWLPTYRDGSSVRFTGKENSLNKFGSHWGGLRIIYLQYSSDPIVFFTIDSLYKKPEWLKEERGPDVSLMFRWYPVVTFFQLLVDLMVSLSSAPPGYGHNYLPSNYIDSWVELTNPPNWNEQKTADLKKLFE